MKKLTSNAYVSITDNTEAMKVFVLAVDATSCEKIVDVGGS